MKYKSTIRIQIDKQKKITTKINSPISHNEEQTLNSKIKHLQLEIQTLENNPNQIKETVEKLTNQVNGGNQWKNRQTASIPWRGQN